MKKFFSPLGMSIVTLAAALAALLSIPLLRPFLSFEGEMITSSWPILAAVFLFLVQEALNPIFSGLALRSIGESARYRTQLLIIMLSTSANSAVPFPAGMPIRAVLQKQFFQIPLAKSAGAMLIETLVGYGIVTACALASGYLWFRVAFEQQLRHFGGSSIVLAALAGSLLAACVIWIVLVKRDKMRGSVMEAGRQAVRARIVPLVGMAVVVLAGMLLALTRFELILQAMGIEAAYGPLLGALLISRLAGVVSLVPMGLGIRDVSLVSMLVMLGVSGPHAIAAAAIDRIIMTVPYLAGGVIATHLLGKQAVESILQTAAGSTLSGADS